MQFFDCLLHFLTSLCVENGALVEKIYSKSNTHFDSYSDPL